MVRVPGSATMRCAVLLWPLMACCSPPHSLRKFCRGLAVTGSMFLAGRRRATPKDYAEMAPLVFECAAKGDVVGMTIVIEGAAAISSLGRALLARGAGKLCLLGGVSKVYPPYLDADVKQALTAPGADALDGAIMMARQAQGFSVSWT